MIAYVDTSILLRVLLNQSNSLKEFHRVERAVASKLLKAELLRSLDRLRLERYLSELEYVKASEEFYQVIDAIELIEITDSVLERVGGSFSVSLGTLDAIHLSSAILWKEQAKMNLDFLTHDHQLGLAARAMGFHVLGCPSS